MNIRCHQSLFVFLLAFCRFAILGNAHGDEGFSNNADLSALVIITARINEPFSPANNTYTANVLNPTSSVTITPTTAQANATVQVRIGANAFSSVNSGSPSGTLALVVGVNTIEVKVIAEDATTTKTYSITITRSNLLPGSLDPLDPSIVGGYVLASAVQPDGKIILGGLFNSVYGVARKNLARLNADGTLDMGFDPKPNSDVVCVAVQTDGKVLIGGEFTALQPNADEVSTIRNCIARLNANGSLDTTFNPNANLGVSCVALQADGKILLGGSFSSLQPNGAPNASARDHIARIKSDGSLDFTFNPSVDDRVISVVVQEDGKILLGGCFTAVKSSGSSVETTRNKIARLDGAGLLDAGFNPNANHEVTCMAVQADGKIVLGGEFTTLRPNGAATTTSRNNLARVNADGSLDTTFNPNPNDIVNSLALQVDGKILFGGWFTGLSPNGSTNPITRNYVARVLVDGTVDTTFNPSANSLVSSLALESDGKILIGGEFTNFQPNDVSDPILRNCFARLLNDPATQALSTPNGTQVLWTLGGSSPGISQVSIELSIDGGQNWMPFGAGIRIGTSPNWSASGQVFPSSGQIRARGRTTTGQFNGSSGLIESVINLSGTGSPAPTVTPSTTNVVSLATSLTINGTGFSTIPAANTVSFTPSGNGIVTASTGTSLTVTYMSGLELGALNAVVTTYAQNSGAAVQVANVIPPPASSLDGLDLNFVGNNVKAITTQPDGKILIGGGFNQIMGVGRICIARLGRDGNLDTNFNPKADNFVFSVAVQPDGKILLGGSFTTLQPNGAANATTRNRIARLNDDGTLDSDFDPNANNAISSVVVQADGKILLAGDFSALQPNGAISPTPRNRIARLNADGSLDTSFNPNANNVVSSIALQADGKILLGGIFTALQPNGAATQTARNRIARLNADGSLDTTFDPKANSAVSTVAVQGDGKILLGGNFTTLQPNGAVSATVRNRIARLNVDGVIDATFSAHASSSLSTITLQADGKILIGGSFTAIQPSGSASFTTRNYVARLNNDGTLDTFFNPNADSLVSTLALQADGKILLGGSFSSLQPGGIQTGRNFFARLLNDPASKILSASSADRVVWTLGGAAPEVSMVTFELSTDGGTNYIPLPGNAARVGISANWQLSGLTLPVNGQLRARGRTMGGLSNSCSGMIEQVAEFSRSNGPEITVTEIDGGNVLNNGLFEFGNTIVGSPVTKTFSITNSGTAPLTLSSLSVPAGFSIVQNFANNTVEAGGTATTFQIRMEADAAGVHDGLLSFLTNDADEGDFHFTVSGTVRVAGPGDFNSLNLNITGKAVLAIAVQPDGKTVLGGIFTHVQGIPRNNIARLNANGTLDPTFDPKANDEVDCIVIQEDGRILIGGLFTALQPNGSTSLTSRNHMARLSADGIPDTFNPGPSGRIYSIVLQPNGKILVAGVLTTTVANYLVRLNSDGSLDSTFNPSPNAGVYSVALQADGKILIAGAFTTLRPNGIGVANVRNYAARLNADGSLDTSFDPKPNRVVNHLTVQPDGRILLGGNFTSLEPNGGTAVPRNCVARLLADGTLDTAFDPNASNIVYSLGLQADGKILIWGDFTNFKPNGANIAILRNGAARLLPDGGIDHTFDPNPNGSVRSVAIQPDGKVLFGGYFRTVRPNQNSSPTSRNLFVQLLNDPATQSIEVTDAPQAYWIRGGSAPEVSLVTFELSTNGGISYTPLLGAVVRVGTTSNWQVTGLSLPPSGHLRARGRTTSGTSNGSSGLVEQVTEFNLENVSITATVPIAVEGGTTPGLYTINRSDATGDLIVTFRLDPASSSTPGADFTLTSTAPLTFIPSTGVGTIIIPHGSTVATIALNAALENQNGAEAAESAILNLVSAQGYAVGSPASATVTIRKRSMIEAWRQIYFNNIENAGNAANFADPDNDGVSNLLEFAFGTVPSSGASGPGELVYNGTLAGNGSISATGQPIIASDVATNNGEMKALFARRKDRVSAGLTYTPQFSVDMRNWEDGAAVATTLAEDENWEVVSIPYDYLIGGRKARFFRILVSLEP